MLTEITPNASGAISLDNDVNEKNRWPNKSVEPNRRPASPRDAGWQYESASCAPPTGSAAVAHLCRSLEAVGKSA